MVAGNREPKRGAPDCSWRSGNTSRAFRTSILGVGTVAPLAPHSGDVEENEFVVAFRVGERVVVPFAPADFVRAIRAWRKSKIGHHPPLDCDAS